MIPFFILAFLSFFLLQIEASLSIDLTPSEIIQIAVNMSLSRTPQFGYAHFLFHPNSKLEVENVHQFHAQNYKECSVSCARNMSCLSFNFGKQSIFFYQGKAQYLCELLPTDKYNSSSKYQSNNPGFDHYSIRSNCSTSPCLHNFTCIPDYDNDTYECSCPRPPFEGKDCKDVDECTTGKHDCSVNAICTNTIRSFNCTCKDGYFGNGTTCSTVTINESDILTDYGNASYLAALKGFLKQVPEDVMNISWIRCWSGKEDGFDVATTFHPQCDGKGPTVTIARKGQYVWGGYTDVPWSSSGGFKSSSKSFIFSLYNIHGFNPMRFDVVDSSKAVYHTVYYGPVFGFDVRIDNNAATSVRNSNKSWRYAIPPGCVYDNLCNFFTDISGEYTIDDIEVFYKQAV